MAEEVATLELIIAAKNELLRQKTQESEAILVDFEKAAERELTKLEERMGGLKVQNLSNSLRAVKQEFRSSFDEIQKMAADAVSKPLLDTGGLNLGAAAAKEAAQVAQQQAVATRIVADAAVKAAASEGQLTRETEIYVRAAVAAADASERRAADLAREAGMLEQLEIETAAATRATGAFNNVQARATVSTGQMRAAQQQLTYNLGDAITMWGMGMKPLQIFTSQASQTAGAIGLMTNESKGFAAFIGGPWFQAVIAAVTILAILAGKHEEGEKKSIDFSNSFLTGRSIIADYTDGIKQLEEATRSLINTQALLIDNSRRVASESVSLLEKQLGDIDKKLKISDALSGPLPNVMDLIGFSEGATLRAERAKVQEQLNAARTALGRATAALEERAATESANPDMAERGAIERERARLRALRARSAEGERAGALLAGEDYISAGDFATQIAALQKRDDAISNRKRGPSAETLAKRAEAARQAVLSDDYSYASEERQARRRLLDATLKTAESEEARDKLLREDIDAEAATQATKIVLRLAQGKITKAEADHLLDLADRTKAQKLQNIQIERASELVQRKAEIEERDIDARIALLTIQQDLVANADERRRIAGEILALEQKQARDRLQRVVDDPRSTPDQRDQAQRDLNNRGPIEQGQRDRLARQNESPLEQYQRSIGDNAANLKDVLKNIEVRRLDELNDGLTDAIMNSKGLGDAFDNVADVAGEAIKGIIADLIRLAIQQTVVNGLAGAFNLGTAGAGGGLFSFLGFESGGFTGGTRGQPRGIVHGEEYVFDAEATARIGVPTLDAIRRGTFASPSINGAVNNANAASAARSGGGVVRIVLDEGAMFEARVSEISGDVSLSVVRQSQPELTSMAVAETTRQLARASI